jgi:hypothetical protein
LKKKIIAKCPGVINGISFSQRKKEANFNSEKRLEVVF